MRNAACDRCPTPRAKPTGGQPSADSGEEEASCPSRPCFLGALATLSASWENVTSSYLNPCAEGLMEEAPRPSGPAAGRRPEGGGPGAPPRPARPRGPPPLPQPRRGVVHAPARRGSELHL